MLPKPVDPGGVVGAIVTGWGVVGRPPYSPAYVSIAGFLILVRCMTVFTPLGSMTGNALAERVSNRIYVSFPAVMTVYMACQTFHARLK